MSRCARNCDVKLFHHRWPQNKKHYSGFKAFKAWHPEFDPIQLNAPVFQQPFPSSTSQHMARTLIIVRVKEGGGVQKQAGLFALAFMRSSISILPSALVHLHLFFCLLVCSHIPINRPHPPLKAAHLFPYVATGLNKAMEHL